MSNSEKIIDVINTLRPFLISDGGDIEFVKLENNIVYVRMNGTCASCEFIDYTITEVILSAIREEVPSIEKVVNLS